VARIIKAGRIVDAAPEFAAIIIVSPPGGEIPMPATGRRNRMQDDEFDVCDVWPALACAPAGFFYASAMTYFSEPNEIVLSILHHSIIKF
jgi:hypothetical protein